MNSAGRGTKAAVEPTHRDSDLFVLMDGPDLRWLDRAPAVRGLLTGLAVCVGAATVAGVAPLGVAIASAAGLGVADLVTTGRRDVARRRLEWAVDAVHASDAMMGPVWTDRTLAGAGGDLLEATKQMHTSTRRSAPRRQIAPHARPSRAAASRTLTTS